ncbi:MAG: DNA gyrase inhibitor YacG [Sedimentisphaerales bacterium]|nr:DNA gyrase inhibitor YacG [Sedimentisphaerales bacterium]
MARRCPVCHKVVGASLRKQPESARFFPFCSRRCKLVDLGAWLDGQYKIVSQPELQQPGEPPAICSDQTSSRQ